MNEIQEKIEETKKQMFEKRLALKKYAKTHDSNDHIKEIVKKYDEYYYNFKTTIKLQIRALEEIVKHLDDVMEEEEIQNGKQITKDKLKILKEIEQLKKTLL
jgi:hypothetical protein